MITGAYTVFGRLPTPFCGLLPCCFVGATLGPVLLCLATVLLLLGYSSSTSLNHVLWASVTMSYWGSESNVTLFDQLSYLGFGAGLYASGAIALFFAVQRLRGVPTWCDDNFDDYGQYSVV